MAKTVTGKKGSKENPIVIDTSKLSKIVEALAPKRAYEITGAVIKDDLCKYSYEVTEGIGIGDPHTVPGIHIIKDEMRKAFASFNVHLAVLDDVFKHADVEFADINKMHGEELTGLYYVTGFQIKGSKDNESIILIGQKYVSQAGGRFELKTPKIPMDSLSSYKWYKELKVAADAAREEVALYKEGNYIVAEVEEETDLKQTSITFDQGAVNDDMKDFEDATV